MSDDLADGSPRSRACIVKEAMAFPTPDQPVEGDSATLTTSRVQQSRRSLVLAAAVILALAGTVAVLGSIRDPTELADGDEIEVTPTTIPATNTTIVPSTNQCSAENLAASLSQGLPDFDFDPLPSPTALVEVSPHVVRGQLLEARAGNGGTELLVRPRQTRNTSGFDPIFQLDSVWTPAAEPPTGTLDGNFVAFLTNERSGGPIPGGWITRLDGLWVACDDVSPAESVLVQTSWPVPVSLNQLWSATSQARPLEPISVAGGAAIFDVNTDDGSRFRLSLPEDLADGLIHTTTVTPQFPIRLEGNKASITVTYGFCPEAERFDSRLNLLGSLVWLDANRGQACRERDQILMQVETDWADREADLELLDFRPIAIGAQYRSDYLNLHPIVSECDQCAQPWGPLVFADQNIVVNQTSPTALTGVYQDTLEEAWKFDPGGFDAYPILGANALYLDVVGRDLMKIDAATGRWLWQLDRGADERATGLAGDLLMSSFSIEGDQTAPLVRRFDPETGAILWTAEGRIGTEWQSAQPTKFDDLVVLMDSSRFESGGVDSAAATLRAYDYSTGDLRWETDLGAGTQGFLTDAIAAFDVDDGRVLLARTGSAEVIRVDPADGTILWSIAVAGGRFGGTDFAEDGTLAIDITRPGPDVLLDPSTGEIVSPPEGPFVCPVSEAADPPFVPPPGWPSVPSFEGKAWFGTNDLWTIVPHGDSKSIWWSAKFSDARTEPSPNLQVIYVRLGGDPARVVLPSPATNGSSGSGLLMAAGFPPESPGCWLATATYKGASLQVIWEQ